MATPRADTFFSIENLQGSYRAANHLTGDSQDNHLRGGSGDDTLIGGAGNDWFIGLRGR